MEQCLKCPHDDCLDCVGEYQRGYKAGYEKAKLEVSEHYGEANRKKYRKYYKKNRETILAKKKAQYEQKKMDASA